MNVSKRLKAEIESVFIYERACYIAGICKNKWDVCGKQQVIEKVAKFHRNSVGLDEIECYAKMSRNFFHFLDLLTERPLTGIKTGLEWTTTTPIAPGHYWFRGTIRGEPDDTPRLLEILDGGYGFEVSPMYSLNHYKGQWAGPLAPPEG